jgi:uncharacterized protein YbjT (DUF2867 family)
MGEELPWLKGGFPSPLSRFRVATRDIAAHAAERLVRQNFTGTEVQDLLGQRDLTLTEAFTVIGRAIGMPGLTYVRFDDEVARQGMIGMGLSADLAGRIIEMSRAINVGLMAVGRPRTVQNSTPTSIEEFAGVFAEFYAAAAEKKAA